MFYEKAVCLTKNMANSDPQLLHLKKRLGNAQNEVGVLLMNQAATLLTEAGELFCSLDEL